MLEANEENSERVSEDRANSSVSLNPASLQGESEFAEQAPGADQYNNLSPSGQHDIGQDN